jgi:hypothetical protein
MSSEIDLFACTKPVLNIFKIKVKQKEKIEKINALVENKMYKHDNKEAMHNIDHLQQV